MEKLQGFIPKVLFGNNIIFVCLFVLFQWRIKPNFETSKSVTNRNPTFHELSYLKIVKHSQKMSCLDSINIQCRILFALLVNYSCHIWFLCIFFQILLVITVHFEDNKMTTTFYRLLQWCGLLSGLSTSSWSLAICVQAQLCASLSAWIRLEWKELCKEERREASSGASLLHLEAAFKLRSFALATVIPWQVSLNLARYFVVPAPVLLSWFPGLTYELLVTTALPGHHWTFGWSLLLLANSGYFLWTCSASLLWYYGTVSLVREDTAPASLIGRLVSMLTFLCESAWFCCVGEQREEGCSLTDGELGVEGGQNTGWGQWPHW